VTSFCLFCIVEHHVLKSKMTFHHNVKKNLFHISTNIPAFSSLLAGQRAQRPISFPSAIASAISSIVFSMIHLDILLLLHHWLSWIYFHRYVDLRLSQHVLRFSVLLQVLQKCLHWSSLPLWNSHLNVSWLLATTFSCLIFASFAILHLWEPLGWALDLLR